HGGEVMKAVPIKGYVLINPASDKGNALSQKWKDDTKPDRHIVCYTFVPACVALGELLLADEMRNAFPLFSISGHPAEIFLHPSLGHERRNKLMKDITKFGGAIAANANLAQVIICDNTLPSFDTLARKYAHDNDVHVEPPEWVRTCIARQRFEHEQIVPKATGGRTKGSKRREYTEEDDRNLAEYLGRRLPSKDMRGRTGNGIYQELCERTDLYPWAAKHTWQSWRNRYKKNQNRIDAMTEVWVQNNPQPVMGKGQYVIAMNKTTAKAARKNAQSSGSTAQASTSSPDRDNSGSEEANNREKEIKRPRKKRRLAKASRSSDADDDAERDVMNAEDLMTQMISNSS
ncbi:hypothetical protein M407DRAFT_78888, partial [Tulasnella calospora MUT 4182]